MLEGLEEHPAHPLHLSCQDDAGYGPVKPDAGQTPLRKRLGCAVASQVLTQTRTCMNNNHLAAY